MIICAAGRERSTCRFEAFCYRVCDVRFKRLAVDTGEGFGSSSSMKGALIAVFDLGRARMNVFSAGRNFGGQSCVSFRHGRYAEARCAGKFDRI